MEDKDDDIPKAVITDDIDETASKVVIPLLKYIIDKGFNLAEISVDEQQVLAQLKRLDRSRLIEIYNQLVTEKSDITKWNYLLNKNSYKYFMRKKSSQGLIKDNPEEVQRLETEFKKRLTELGEVIAKHEKTRVILSSQSTDLMNERNELFRVQKEATVAFENIVHNTGRSLKSLQSGRMLSPEVIQNIMTQIQTSRSQISEARLHFIKTLDRHTQMEVKANELQDLGNGLRMNDFSQLREERQCLEEKIEERNNTLEKLRLRCFSDTQILSHVREKKFMLESTQEEEMTAYKDAIHEMEITRNFMNSCSSKLEGVRKYYAEISTNCGLLDKPDLLRNFDDTESEFKLKKKNIEGLHRDIGDINKKIANFTRKESKKSSKDSVNTTTKKTFCISQSALKIKKY